MYDEIQSPFEQLWSLLNFSQEEIYTSVGEVEKELASHHENVAILAKNTIGAMMAIVKISDTFNSHDTDAELQLTNLLEIQKLISQWSEMMQWCFQRDIIAMETFLESYRASGAQWN